MHLAGEGQRVVGIGGSAEPDPRRRDDVLRTGPVADVARHQPDRGVDVQEDVGRSAGVSEIAVVVDVLEVAGREGAADDQGRR